MYYHRAWADIDLDALTHNLETIRSHISPEVRIMAVVKADAYGHDALAVARHLQDRDGVWGFGVGDSHEALELREGKITSPILILGAIVEDEIGRVLENDISVCVHSQSRAERLNREALRQGRRLKVHLMVDTGMGRLGVTPETAAEVAERIAAAQGLELAGVATHYSSTGNPNDPFTLMQHERFVAVKERLARAGISPGFFHASNSAAVFSSLAEHFNIIRPGISLYGISYGGSVPADVDLRPVLSFKTQVVFMKDMPAGAPVGYNRTHITSRPTRIATIPIGYNDGYSFRLSGKGQVLIRGRRAPVVGAVSMDYTMVDIGHIPGVEVGDLVTLIGRDGDESVRVEELAEFVGTIPYEITCSIGKRVRRIPRKMKKNEKSGGSDSAPGVDTPRAEAALQ
jgi:alanine racemase